MGSREALTLSKRCRDIVIGTILGDGCLERNGTNVRLRIDHGVSQVSFVEWKWHELSELRPLTPRIVERVDKRTGRRHVNYRFTTRSMPVLNHYFTLFYEPSVKRIPTGIAELLRSTLSLAVWYMDDGGRRGDCRSGYLNTNAYSVHDVDLLRKVMADVFGVRTSTHFAAGKPRIYIPQSQFENFCDLVRPHVIPEMSYKLL